MLFLDTLVAPSCHLPLHVCNRSLFGSGISINSHAYVISQHARWPTRTPPPTCANQDAWVAITPKRPNASSIHTAAWHAWTRTPPLKTVQKAVFSLIHFSASFILPLAIVPFWLGGSRHDWGLFLEETERLHCSSVLNRTDHRLGKWGWPLPKVTKQLSRLPCLGWYVRIQNCVSKIGCQLLPASSTSNALPVGAS